ncbi:unnamed protein product [Phytomonas sp. Hart1]|nr:unnamed protein product [Phytomonas sp. Hart1]|eukprot:CCW67387.1 unnamed protein product [Phytomonas sp. isolate Hart1]
MAAITFAAGGNTPMSVAANEPNQQAFRAFNLLDNESQERLIRLKSHYDNLLPMEKGAFVEMLGLPIDAREVAALCEPQDKTYHVALYHSERYDEVRRRDVGFAILRQGQTPPLSDPPADNFAVSDVEFRSLLTPALFGEGELPLRVQKQALYDRVGMLRGDEETTAAETDEKEEKNGSEIPSKQASTTHTDNLNQIPGIYRSNGYQSLRLGYSFPVQLNLERAKKGEMENACGRVYNLSGIPIEQNQLREWFDSLGPRRFIDSDDDEAEEMGDTEDNLENLNSLDTNRDNYYIDMTAFLDYMRSLDRDFGASSIYEQLEKDCEALAKDGDKLGFGAFAYLMLRFLRT